MCQVASGHLFSVSVNSISDPQYCRLQSWHHPSNMLLSCDLSGRCVPNCFWILDFVAPTASLLVLIFRTSILSPTGQQIVLFFVGPSHWNLKETWSSLLLCPVPLGRHTKLASIKNLTREGRTLKAKGFVSRHNPLLHFVWLDSS